MKKSIITILCIASACISILAGCKEDAPNTRNTPVQEPYSITQEDPSPDDNGECPNCGDDKNAPPRELPPPRRNRRPKHPTPHPLPAPMHPSY